MSLGKFVTDFLDHFFDTEFVKVGDVAALVSSVDGAVSAELDALVPDVGDGAVADLAADEGVCQGSEGSVASSGGEDGGRGDGEDGSEEEYRSKELDHFIFCFLFYI